MCQAKNSLCRKLNLAFPWCLYRHVSMSQRNLYSTDRGQGTRKRQRIYWHFYGTNKHWKSFWKQPYAQELWLSSLKVIETLSSLAHFQHCCATLHSHLSRYLYQESKSKDHQGASHHSILIDTHQAVTDMSTWLLVWRLDATNNCLNLSWSLSTVTGGGTQEQILHDAGHRGRVSLNKANDYSEG